MTRYQDDYWRHSSDVLIFDHPPPSPSEFVSFFFETFAFKTHTVSIFWECASLKLTEGGSVTWPCCAGLADVTLVMVSQQKYFLVGKVWMFDVCTVAPFWKVHSMIKTTFVKEREKAVQSHKAHCVKPVHSTVLRSNSTLSSCKKSIMTFCTKLD